MTEALREGGKCINGYPTPLALLVASSRINVTDNAHARCRRTAISEFVVATVGIYRSLLFALI